MKFRKLEKMTYEELQRLYDDMQARGDALEKENHALQNALEKQAEGSLKQIEWMLNSDNARLMVCGKDGAPEYGDLTELNTNRVILDSVGKTVLTDIVGDFLQLLGTSAAVYESNGDYALGIFSSKWCRLMDASSRRLCNTGNDQEALADGKWLCHECCSEAWKACMESGEPVDTACAGGIRIYAAPIYANEEIIGSINMGYGDPPREPDALQHLSENYGVAVHKLLENAEAYESRPPFIVEIAKSRLLAAARLIGEIVACKKIETTLRESEEKHRILVENLNEVIYALDKNARITYISQTVQSVAGYTPSELMGKKYTDFVHPDDKKSLLANFQASSLDIDKPAEYRLITKDNRIVWVRTVARPLFKAGNVTGVQGVLSDITRRKQAEENLRQSEQRYRSIISLSNTGAWEYDSAKGSLWCSPEYLSMLGYDPEDFDMTSGLNLKEVWIDFLHPEDRDPAAQLFAQYLAGGSVGMYEQSFRMRHKEGDWVFIWSRGQTFRNPDGTPTNITLGTHIDITEFERVQQQMNEREEKYRRIAENITDVLWTADLNFNVNYVSPSIEKLTGESPEADMSRTMAEKFPPAHLDNIYRIFAEELEKEKDPAVDKDRARLIEAEVYKADGGTVWVSINISGIRDENGRLVGVQGVSRDISQWKQSELERDKLQAQLNQAQKMESVGRLAGGVAHDFNNMLTIINGYAEMMADLLEPSDPMYDSVREIHDAGKRSAVIVRKLLAFARKQVISPVPTNLNDSISSMITMLEKLIGENIDLLWKPGPNTWLVYMDYSQLDQILANLVVNARDAIADIGKITIETENVAFDEEYCLSHAGFVPGQFAMLAVSDNGCGMDTHVLDKLFEPFFTTKEVDKGTGLGMPTVYGAVKQNNGFINVYSEPGKGTTVRVYLPRFLEKAGEADRKNSQTPVLQSRGETVMVLEDESTVLNIARIMLEKLGYTVLAASSASEAMTLAEANDGKIDLLLTDIVMPEMNGLDFSAQLKSCYPDIKNLYMSGYTADVIARHGMLDEGMQFIQKPFSIQELAIKVREAIES